MSQIINHHILSSAFYSSQDTLLIAKKLLGKVIVTHIDGQYTSGMIVETEAYLAPEDQASHAKNYRRTPRTHSFYMVGGTAYVYICYGIHHLFNVITGPKNFPHAILIRGLEPLDGLDTMMRRRNLSQVKKNISAGPGILSEALGIKSSLDGIDLTDAQSPIVIEDRNISIPKSDIVSGPRIGIDSAGEPWVSKPYRFYIQNNKWVSR